MPCQATRDANGWHYFVPPTETVRTPGGKRLPGFEAVDVWWSRGKGTGDERLIIRQPNEDKADVIELSLAQVYDLIHALGCAVLRP